MFHIQLGVYIGKDIEFVYTEKYSMIFRRNNEENYLESILLSAQNACIGICRTSPCSSKMSFKPDKWEHALFGEKTIYSDENIKAYLGRNLVTITSEGNDITAVFYDGASYQAQMHEPLTMEQLSPVCYSADERAISECLVTWHVACKEIIWNNTYIGVIINTYKHMYIFEMTEHSIYCRAARYAASDKGVVFNQNFRQGLHAYMLDDNRDAMNELEYSEDLFDTDACAWADGSVYWSVHSVEKERIKLRGCQGDSYEWVKPR